MKNKEAAKAKLKPITFEEPGFESRHSSPEDKSPKQELIE